ncbi:exosomal polycystin-1-interacting protein [Dromaius novaehollandiae]|uniref:exosomal polycystin-1-interacting protein n=1 Tax=Dromaius novaehollandiae TaxID=8790 RepID=UPI00311EBEF2
MLGSLAPALMKPIPLYTFSFWLVLFLAGFLGLCITNRFVRSQKNHTLIFTRESTIRNCSCLADIRDCDYSLANLMCNCKTVLPSTMEKTSYNSNLTIWFTDTSGLEMVLNFTRVCDLKLSFCGTTPLPTEYLIIWGLRKLRVNNKVKGQFPEQSVTIYSSSNNEKGDPFAMHNKDRQMLVYISFLDTSLFNGYSLLKSYSVENVSSITEHFPSLLYSDAFSTSDNKSYVVTFIY